MIDTHAHINHEKLKDELPEILSSLETSLKAIICPSYDKTTCKTTMDFCQKYEKVFGALAIHPSEDKTYDAEIENFIKVNAKNSKVVAIGEYGLDYHYLPYNKNLQQEVMQKQLEIAKQTKLPSIFHVRDAFDDFIEIIKENKQGFCGGVVHCFDGDIEIAKQLLDLDLMISFTGIVTHKKREELLKALKYVPIDRMMLETDSPYLAPEPFRGKVCVPMYVEKVYDKVCEIKNIDKEELKIIMQNNAKNFFKKLVI